MKCIGHLLFGLGLYGYALLLNAQPNEPDAYDSLGLLHNAVLERAERTGILSAPALTERAFAENVWMLAFDGNATAGRFDVPPFFDRYEALPTGLEHRRAEVYNALALAPDAISILEQFYHLPDSLPFGQTMAAIRQLRQQARTATQIPALQKSLVQAVLAISYHSARHWHSSDLRLLQKQPLYKPDSLRQVRWRKLMMVDGYGALKGTLFGLFFFGSTAFVWPRNFVLSFVGGGAILAFFPIFESARYARRLRLGMLRLEDNPFDPPYNFKETPPAKEGESGRIAPQ